MNKTINLDKIIIKTNKTPILLFFRILFAIVLIDIVFILLISFVDFFFFKKSVLFLNYSFEENIFLLFIFFHLFFFIYLFVYWFVDYYKIMGGKIYHFDGILFKKKEIFVINKINTIKLYQSFFGRIFNYGNISLYYSDYKIILKSIPFPEEFINFIEFFKEKK